MEFVMADIALVIECLHLSSFVLSKLCAQYVQILHRIPSGNILCDYLTHFHSCALDYCY